MKRNKTEKCGGQTFQESWSDDGRSVEMSRGKQTYEILRSKIRKTWG